jgi:formylglycine-generating enzyme required for sulfatase activity
MGISASCTIDDIPEVGSKPAGIGFFGQHDLAGSMWEWVFDFDGQPFPVSNPCDNCRNRLAPTDDRRQIRGGAWNDDDIRQTVGWRDASDPQNTRWDNVGVRCARPL